MRSPAARLALPVLVVTLLTGCGVTGPDTYELGQKNVRVEVGEEFTLSVPVDVPMGEHWYLTSPQPDAAVVRTTGEREERESQELDGAGKGTDLFDFKAVGEGTTKIRLIQCPNGACAGGGSEGGAVTPSPVPSGSPTPQAKYRAKIHIYTVTVK